MVQQFAQNEQNMNAVERVLVYTELSRESDSQTPNDPPTTWPEKGGVKFTEASLAYREGLPLVLKGISFEVAPGEKVGAVAFEVNWILITCYADRNSRSYWSWYVLCFPSQLSVIMSHSIGKSSLIQALFRYLYLFICIRFTFL
jgi:ABC-type multidrug transport system fused ATPase/permease subunit